MPEEQSESECAGRAGVHEREGKGRGKRGGWGDMFINIRTDHIHTKGSWLSQDIAPDF